MWCRPLLYLNVSLMLDCPAQFTFANLTAGMHVRATHVQEAHLYAAAAL